MDEDKLYAIAMTCARMSDEGCNTNCGVCQFNIFNYIRDVREASLLKATAYTDYYRAKEANEQADKLKQSHTLGAIIGPIAVIIGLLLLFRGC